MSINAYVLDQTFSFFLISVVGWYSSLALSLRLSSLYKHVHCLQFFCVVPPHLLFFHQTIFILMQMCTRIHIKINIEREQTHKEPNDRARVPFSFPVCSIDFFRQTMNRQHSHFIINQMMTNFSIWRVDFTTHTRNPIIH